MRPGRALAFQETTHAAHSYRQVVARWRRVARAAGLKLEAFAQAGEYPVYCLRTRRDLAGGFYLSAGIHGDEPGGVEGLLTWAEQNLPALARDRRSPPLLILPCLNPWGLVNNIRSDQRGRDLNRLFDRRRLTPIRELKRLLKGQSFACALMLHEDYDGRGVYLYEIHARGHAGWGQQLLRAAAAAIPIDPRRRIDARPFRDGCALRMANLARLPLHPEAIYLYLFHAARVITFETPSEFALATRVHAQVRSIAECLLQLQRAER